MAAVPACLEEPDGSVTTLSSSADSLKTGSGSVGTTLASYIGTSSSAMDAIDGPRAQQLYYYFGKGQSLLTNAEESAKTSGEAIGNYAQDLSDVKEVLGTNRDRWLQLESERLMAVIMKDAAKLAMIEAGQAACELVGYEQQARLLTARSMAAEKLAAIYLELDPLAVSMEAKAYEAELFQVRDGMSLQDLGYPTPEAQAEWFMGEGLSLKEHEMTYSEVAQAGFGTMSEADMLAAGIITQDEIDDGLFTPGAIPGYEQPEAWQGIIEQYLGQDRLDELDVMFPGLFNSTGSPLTTPYDSTPDLRCLPLPIGPHAPGSYGVTSEPVPSDGPKSGAAHNHFVPQEVSQWLGYTSAARHVWRFYGSRDGRAYRLADYFMKTAMDKATWMPDVNPGDLAPIKGTEGIRGARFYNPFLGESAFAPDGRKIGDLTPAERAEFRQRLLWDGKKPGTHKVPATGVANMFREQRTGRLSHIQEGIGNTAAWKNNGMIFGTLKNLGMDDARVDSFVRNLNAVDVNTARGLGILGVAGDAQTLIGGTQYDGVRGGIDYGMAGVGLASGAAGLASTAGLVTLGTVAAPVTLAAGVAAGAWGVGNMLYDNAENWSGSLDNAGNTADQWLGDNLGTVGEGIGWAVNGGLDGVGTALNGYKNTIDGIGDAWNNLWN